MIYTVTLNPSLDYLLQTERLRPGALCRTQKETLHPGGKGINVSLVLHALGMPTRALGFSAGQTGELFGAMLAQTGVQHEMIPLPRGMTRINVKVHAQEETELNGRGPAIPQQAFAMLAARLDELTAGDWLVLSGSLPQDVPADAYARLLDRVRGRGVKTLVDTAGDALKNALPCGPDLIKPNREEFADMVGGAPHSAAGIAACARELQRAGARTILISRGGESAVLVLESGEALQLAPPAGEIAQTVGAGDAMSAAWIYAVENGMNAVEALRWAVAAGSAAAFSPWLPDRAAIEQALAQTGTPQPVE